jgi:hypothetical protein
VIAKANSPSHLPIISHEQGLFQIQSLVEGCAAQNRNRALIRMEGAN